MKQVRFAKRHLETILPHTVFFPFLNQRTHHITSRLTERFDRAYAFAADVARLITSRINWAGPSRPVKCSNWRHA